MTSERPLHRLQTTISLVALGAGLTVLIVAMDAIRCHAAVWIDALARPLTTTVHPLSLAVLLLAVADAAVIGLALRSLARRLIRNGRFLRRLPTREAVLCGHGVRVFADRRPHAFCGGWLRPRVYLSDGALGVLAPEELAAVLEHERHHARRRDPLRAVVAAAASDAFAVIPPLASVVRRQPALAELAADSVAVRAAGSPAPLASALLVFEESGVAGAGVAPERVDHLAGDERICDIPRWVTWSTFAVVVLLAGASVLLAAGVSHPEPLVAVSLAVVSLSAPVWSIGRLGAAS